MIRSLGQINCLASERMFCRRACSVIGFALYYRIMSPLSRRLVKIEACRSAQGSVEMIDANLLDAAILAQQGDTTALRLCLEPIAPPRRDNPAQFPLPRIATAHDAARAAEAVLYAGSSGDLTPNEAGQIIGLVDSYRRTLETSEPEARVAAIEGGEPI